MTKKIFRSIFTVALVVLLASIGIATSFLYDYYNDSQVKRLKAELSLVADTVNEVGVEYFENFDSTVFRFTVIDTDGTVLYDTQANASEMENHADREEISQRTGVALPLQSSRFPGDLASRLQPDNISDTRDIVRFLYLRDGVGIYSVWLSN